jgi:hypothetical protein
MRNFGRDRRYPITNGFREDFSAHIQGVFMSGSSRNPDGT